MSRQTLTELFVQGTNCQSCTNECLSPAPPDGGCKNGAGVQLVSNHLVAMRLVREGYDWEYVGHYLATRSKLPSKMIAPTIKALQEFLSCCLLSELPQGMFSTVVDLAWHACILDTARWRNFMEFLQRNLEISVVPIDHKPTLPGDRDDGATANFVGVHSQYFSSANWKKCLQYDGVLN